MPEDTAPTQSSTVQLVSQDSMVVRQITEAMQELALAVEPCALLSVAADRCNRRKFDAVVIDLAMGGEAAAFIGQVRGSPSNRTTVIFALTSSPRESAHALNQGANFVLERPLTPDAIRNTLRVAYGLILRERRRYFRYAISVPVVLNRRGAPEIFGRTVNVSECGMAIHTPTALASGAEVTAQFTVRPDPLLQIKADAKVCWNNERGEIGLSFLFLPHDQASELQSWLAKKLEELLPKKATSGFAR